MNCAWLLKAGFVVCLLMFVSQGQNVRAQDDSSHDEQPHDDSSHDDSSHDEQSHDDHSHDDQWVVYGPGPDANDKRIVLIAGDDEYRSEECMPMLGQILSQHHGFECTVLFPVNPQSGEIQPDFQKNIPGIESVADADLVIMGLRFRDLPDSDMEVIDEYLKAGKPVMGLRTTTHAFRMGQDSSFKHYSFNSKEWPGGFGQQVLGDTWVNHHGHHKSESTRGIVNQEHADHVVLKGIDDVWGDTDVYGINKLPDEAQVLLHGQVLAGMSPDDAPVEGKKNDPMMPIAWFKDYQLPQGEKGLAFCTTMGSSTDFASADLRRLVVNASYFMLGMEDKIKADTMVDFVTEYKPTMFGFKSYTQGVKPSDFKIEK